MSALASNQKQAEDEIAMLEFKVKQSIQPIDLGTKLAHSIHAETERLNQTKVSKINWRVLQYLCTIFGVACTMSHTFS